MAIPALALALVAGLTLPAAADDGDDCPDGSVVVQMPGEDGVREVPINLFGDGNVIVPGDASDDVVLCVVGTGAAIRVDVIDVALLNEDADDIYEHLLVRGTPVAEIQGAYTTDGSWPVLPPDLGGWDQFDGLAQVSFDWYNPVIYREEGSPGNVASVGTARQVTLRVRITTSGDEPTDPNGPPPPVEPCPWDPDLDADDPLCKVCPWNPDLIAGHPDCKEPPVCPWDPTLPPGHPDCKVCPWNPDLIAGHPDCRKPPVEKCPWNPTLPPDHPDCRKPSHVCPWNPDLPFNDPNCVRPVCPPNQPCPPGYDAWPPHDGGGGIIAETGGFLIEQPLWIYGLAALGIAAVIGFARKRPQETA